MMLDAFLLQSGDTIVNHQQFRNLGLVISPSSYHGGDMKGLQECTRKNKRVNYNILSVNFEFLTLLEAPNKGSKRTWQLCKYMI